MVNNFTREQKYQLYTKWKKNLFTPIQSWMSNFIETNVDEELCAITLIDILLYFNVIKPINIIELIKTNVSSFRLEALSDKIATELIVGKSQIGKILQNITHFGQIYDNSIYKQIYLLTTSVCKGLNDKISTDCFIYNLFNIGYKQVYIQSVRYQADKRTTNQKLWLYAKMFDKHRYYQILNYRIINKLIRMKMFQEIKKDVGNYVTQRQKTIKNLLNILDSLEELDKYQVIIFISYLYNISDEQYEQHFNWFPKNIAKDIIQLQTVTFENFFLKFRIVQYTDDSTIEFKFQIKQILTESHTQDLQQLFQNVEHRIQLLKSNIDYFYIIHNTQTGQIQAGLLDSKQLKNNTQMLLNYVNETIYNVIICGWDFKCVEQIRMKYLCYYSCNPLSLNLKHPKDLKVICGHQITIQNISECYNLTGIHMQKTIIKQFNIINLTKLKLIALKEIQYEGEAPLLQALFQKSSPEYVNIQNVQGQVYYQLNKNIRNLRVLYIIDNHQSIIQKMCFQNQPVSKENTRILSNRSNFQDIISTPDNNENQVLNTNKLSLNNVQALHINTKTTFIQHNYQQSKKQFSFSQIQAEKDQNNILTDIESQVSTDKMQILHNSPQYQLKNEQGGENTSQYNQEASGTQEISNSLQFEQNMVYNGFSDFNAKNNQEKSHNFNLHLPETVIFKPQDQCFSKFVLDINNEFPKFLGVLRVNDTKKEELIVSQQHSQVQDLLSNFPITWQ